jgi:uncharacterized protein YgbK (DUF1537 family)
LQQIATAEDVMAVFHLEPDRVVSGRDEVARALAWAAQRITEGPILIASSSTPDQVAALQSRHGRDAAGHAIEQAMADIAEGLVQRGVRRLVVAGGETSGAVVDRLGIPGFLVGAEIAPGVPVLRAVGAKEGEMVLALKSGNFGGPGFFSDALDLMR